jgi:UDP-glucose:(glucosyl)LPS alpha-1,3-glucosyltransferase
MQPVITDFSQKTKKDGIHDMDNITLNVDSLHIAFGVDTHYFRGMGVTITSILIHNPDIDFTFHVFSPDISENNRYRLKELAQKYKTSIFIHIIDPSVFDEFSTFPRLTHYSPAIFTRFLMPAALQKFGDIEKFLYLDSDILCIGSLSDLMNINISNAIVALVHDNSIETSRTQCAVLKLQNNGYFNSGVLYINITNWIAYKVTHMVITKMLTSPNKFQFPDQDALNIELDGRGNFIDGKWNYQYNLVDELKKNKISFDVPSNTVFVHFTGRMKPWHDWNPHDSKKLFLHYQSLSTWSDVPLDQPKNYKEMHMHAHFLIKDEKIGAGIRWYVKYLMSKYFGLFQAR